MTTAEAIPLVVHCARQSSPTQRLSWVIQLSVSLTFIPLSPRQLFIIVPLILALIHQTDAIRWLSIAHVSSFAPGNRDDCTSLNGLSKRQMNLCRRNLEHMESVKLGAQMSLTECQHQFRNRRWNCTIQDPVSVFGNALKLGTREAAFIHSISAAGVSFTVTRDCSSGKLDKCGCDRSIRGSSNRSFQWAGCSDNIHYGNAFSRAFVDAQEKRKSQLHERMLMNLHNNEAGRKIIERNMRTNCKCHGVSGSCELKTCWKSMPTFRDIGTILKEKFDGATEIKLFKKGTRRRLIPTNDAFKPQTDEDLVYLDTSPDYCSEDKEAGTPGTTGRLCNKTSKAIDGCDLLCCGRGYKNHVEKRVERCHCKFHWCCHVKCKECETVVEINSCL